MEQETEMLRRMNGDLIAENQRLIEQNRQLRERCEHAERIIRDAPMGILIQNLLDHLLSLFRR